MLPTITGYRVPVRPPLPPGGLSDRWAPGLAHRWDTGRWATDVAGVEHGIEQCALSSVERSSRLRLRTVNIRGIIRRGYTSCRRTDHAEPARTAQDRRSSGRPLRTSRARLIVVSQGRRHGRPIVLEPEPSPKPSSIAARGV